MKNSHLYFKNRFSIREYRFSLKTKIVVYIILVFLLTVGISCKKETPTSNTSTTSQLDNAFSSAAQIPNLKSLVVFKDSRIVREEYFGGCDSNSLFDVRSDTKSVMATLIGIAIDKGYIHSEDDSVGNYLRPLNGNMDSVKANIKIRDLLSMTSGIFGNELTNASDYDNWFNSPNQVNYTLNTSMTSQPGKVFNYISGVAHLTSAILTQATGMSTFQFAQEYLFQPLGIADHYWQTDKQGIYNGGAGLNLTSHDIIKIGELYLNKGLYNGVRVVSQTWTEKASSFKITTNNAQPFGPSYGYFWWIGNIHGHDYFWANGYGGQFIVVVPDIKLVVSTTNTWSGVATATANQQWYSTLDIIMNKIILSY
jgi:CubicO group peptidase (beta-lactamase class C family)